MSDELTPCHPYDERCGGSGGPCRNHGGFAVLRDVLDARAVSGLDGYFVGEDAHGDVCVWRERGDYPVPILGRRELRDDLELWDAIVAVVEGAS